ncbi:hypothetical protein OHA77_00890 [Streptosporangium sp. NBC_01639]|nr:hypothetical protein OHA77_00890 [Streptosporangium sp. NBC_01639]
MRSTRWRWSPNRTDRKVGPATGVRHAVEVIGWREVADTAPAFVKRFH